MAGAGATGRSGGAELRSTIVAPNRFEHARCHPALPLMSWGQAPQHSIRRRFAATSAQIDHSKPHGVGFISLHSGSHNTSSQSPPTIRVEAKVACFTVALHDFDDCHIN